MHSPAGCIQCKWRGAALHSWPTINTQTRREVGQGWGMGNASGPEYVAPRSCSRLHKAVIMPPLGGKLYIRPRWVGVCVSSRDAMKHQPTHRAKWAEQPRARVTYFATPTIDPSKCTPWPRCVATVCARENRCKWMFMTPGYEMRKLTLWECLMGHSIFKSWLLSQK
jgi:hypothetical protein